MKKMGEATYYLKARYATATEASLALTKFTALVMQGRLAYEFWQKHRGDDRAWFWREFEATYPDVTTYLRDAGLFGGDHDNALAGFLDFGDEEADPPYLLDASGEVVAFVAECWHCADWEPIAAWLLEHTGANIVRWLTDEDVEPMDVLTV